MQTKHINDYDNIILAQNGDEKALCDIIQTNLGLVKTLAMKFIDRSIEYDDLVQIGTIGMIKAVKKFDTSFNTAFSTYAVPMIIGEIKRFLRDDGIIKISRSAKKNAYDISKFRESFRNENNREPTFDEISELCGISREDIVFALEAAQPIHSLNETNDDESLSFEEIVGEDNIDEINESLSLNECLAKLEKEEKMLIKLRYYKNLTQQQTAKVMGYSQVKVSREEKRIFQKLRKIL